MFLKKTTQFFFKYWNKLKVLWNICAKKLASKYRMLYRIYTVKLKTTLSAKYLKYEVSYSKLFFLESVLPFFIWIFFSNLLLLESQYLRRGSKTFNLASARKLGYARKNESNAHVVGCRMVRNPSRKIQFLENIQFHWKQRIFIPNK